MGKKPHIILETANFHGGNPDLLKKLIVDYAKLNYPNLGLKFHAHKYDKVALPDFSWYQASKEFHIVEEEWASIIDMAAERGFNVWMDLFCVYGVFVLGKNLDKIFGIKLQPSILDNREILAELAKLDLTEKVFIMNVAGLELTAIEKYIEKFRPFHFKEIVLQAGFQSYPTQIEDTSLSKIQVLKANFPHLALSYADHISAEDGFSVRFPVYAYLQGCSFLEKHVCLSRKETKYDVDSALEVPEIEAIIREIEAVDQCRSTEFITRSERRYFDKTIQKPVLSQALNPGQLAGDGDILFRRTDKPGMNIRELKSLQQNFYILERGLSALDTVTLKDFKRARIGVIVAARLKSSRLKQKAILPINGVPSIERCLQNCLKFPYQDEVILATSTLEEDAVLEQYTLDGAVKFWQGDPEDVISRYLGACERYAIDVVVRLTGDSPVVSPEIAKILLEAHFREGADFTEARGFAIGTNCQVYNVEALQRVIGYLGRADYSEHMTLYMTNNPELFKVNYVELPPELRRNYRLTLDYPEDHEMFEILFKRLESEKLTTGLIDIFKILDENPEIGAINAHRTQVYNTDKKLIALLNEKTKISLSLGMRRKE